MNIRRLDGVHGAAIQTQGVLADVSDNSYTLLMDRGIIYNQSAFKHGITRADIEWAFLHPIRNGLLEDYTNKYLLIGFDAHGSPVEVMYNRIDEERVNVFHAMKCRKGFLPHGKDTLA